MTTKKPILNFVVGKELLEAIDEYWHRRKLPTRAESVRELIRLGLQKAEKEKQLHP